MPLTYADEISGAHAVCPNCSSALRISRANPSSQNPLGVHRFECRSCPYEYPLDKDYFEETVMKQKEVEDVFGSKDEFKNADSIATQCPAEGCDGDRAYFFQLQIRSADEPMTTFLKVSTLGAFILRPVLTMRCQCTTCGARWREN
ncbi:hypothetical protein Egran_04111 [Elaphomyces granulatus]|uniref:TFIIS-type domain-containing protein n=1 Tax=Elaphomyces granulatus TaxID=519963 RepID=A0A232LVI6_9EURO|nr:hypothetical protein Egran_04111 [Elaphomyces granulatus]